MRWYGRIGYGRSVTDNYGVTTEEIIEKEYYGDVIRNNRRWNDSNSINGDVQISNQISILSDPFIIANFHSIRYAEFMGVLWKVTDVEVQYPRLLLTLGGEYHGGQTISE